MIKYPPVNNSYYLVITSEWLIQLISEDIKDEAVSIFKPFTFSHTESIFELLVCVGVCNSLNIIIHLILVFLIVVILHCLHLIHFGSLQISVLNFPIKIMTVYFLI